MLDVRLAVFRIGVRGGPGRQAALPAQLLDTRQHREEVEHGVGVVPASDGIPEAEHVGLGLIVSRVLEEEQLEALRGHAGVLRQLRPEHDAEAEPQLRELGPAHLSGGVPRGHVPDFVAHDPGQLGLRVHIGQDPAGHVDVAPGEREGVHLGVVHDGECPGELGTLRLGRELLAERGHVRLPGGVLVGPGRHRHLLGGLEPHGDFLALRHQVEFLLPRGGVDRTPHHGQ